MARRMKYGQDLRKYIKKYNLKNKIATILSILGADAQDVVNWAEKEAEERITEEAKGKKVKRADVGREVFRLIGLEAAIRLVRANHAKGRLTTKSEVKKKTGQKLEMPLLYREAGLRHPQEARNLRHNMFHEAFLALTKRLFPKVETFVPSTGGGLTPDLMVKHPDESWSISVEYKGYRSITLLSESEILKGMRYQEEFGTSWLVTTTTKSVRNAYGPRLKAKELIEQGVERLRNITKRKNFTEEQRENRGIALKGIRHLQKHIGNQLSCRLLDARDLLESCKKGKPLKGLSITTGFEFVDLLRENGLNQEADNVLRVMKSPTRLLHSDTITSVRLID